MPSNAHSITIANDLPLARYASVRDVIETMQPSLPLYALHPHAFNRVARSFIDGFPGETMYAVKANHALPVLQMIHAAGIGHFDVASIAEVRLISERFPKARKSFMSPVRIRGTSGEAYRLYGVRDFALDSKDELEALLDETGAAADKATAQSLTLYVRLHVPADGALLELSSKFGIRVSAAAALLKDIVKAGARPALTFHVGSQCLFPSSFTTALSRCGEVLAQSGIEISALDVGGGFPGYYQNVTVPPLDEFFDAIREGIALLPLAMDCAILCEPGRALVADGLSVITRVSHRRDHTLFINDGIYGSLNEYALKNWPVRYPLRAFTSSPAGRTKEKRARLASFKVYGPTCDSLDVLHYLIDLPNTIAAGDWIEFQMLGAYSCSLRTAFNGFYPDTFVEIEGPIDIG
ncbi:MAG: type III PLP-dependent enzyme [Micropepsaceae bacterium]